MKVVRPWNSSVHPGSLVIACFLVFTTSTPLFSQTLTGDTVQPRQVMVVVAPLDESIDDTVTPQILRNGVEQMLSRQGMTVIFSADDGVTGPLPVPGERRFNAILASVDSQGADLVIGAFFLNTEGQFFVQFFLYDPAANIPLGGILARARQGLTVFAGVEAAVSNLEPVVERYLTGEHVADDPEGIVESVVVRGGSERADVFFIDRLVGRIANGSLLVPFVQYEIDTPLRILVEKPGYHSIDDIFVLNTRESVVELPPMERQTRFDLGIRWTFGMAPGVAVAARFHIVPDTQFISLEHHRMVQPALSENARDVQFFDYSFTVGRYLFFGYRSRVRFHLGVGAGVTVADVIGLGGQDYHDWYVIAGEPTIEINLGRSSFFLRPDLRYSLGVDYNTLGRIWVRTPYDIIPISVGARFSW